MTLENKLGLTEAAELARAEEKLSKAKAALLFEHGLLDTLPTGTLPDSRLSTSSCLKIFIPLPGKCAM